MIKPLNNVKDKILVVFLLLYIISSYVCQEALLPPRLNSLLLIAFVVIAIIYSMFRANTVNLNFSKWYLIFFLYSLCSALLMTNNVMPTLYHMGVILVLTFCYSISIYSEKVLELTVITYVISAVLRWEF